ncbi:MULTISPECIES: flavin-containing monooxygenase [unclassified Streptomyces]|uniref:flavin-containing monooxygenase n=1 Tax=Streptomyces TaxID=1883 RepID=UPI001F366B61|nr:MULTISPECIES: NAD(P)-binding domain-containing protein [unclassified Streptomyces]MCU4748894.1 NAD(P)-binding domain-containing protein [Streptomyces sp. G-5]
MGTNHRQRVCVIGAGAAGLEALRVLRAEGLEVDCFERTGRVGGHWHTDYEALHLITPRGSSGFEGAPMPADYPLFPSRDQVRDYLEEFADREGLRPHITLDTEITAVEREPQGPGWLVRTADGTRRAYDAVVVANGHHWDPKLPKTAADFAGRSLHSGEYRNTGDIDGERVLVVGSGNSGCDLAVDAANARLRTDISVRNGHVFQPKTFFGRPRNELPLVPRLPGRLAERVTRTLVKISVGTAERYPGLPTPATENLNEQLPVVNELLLYWIQHGRIAVRPGIEAIEGRTVRFTDGTRREYDTVLWATGFRVSLPFLPPELLTWRGGAPLRTAGLTVPTGVPGLYFVGLASPRGPQFPVFSAQSRLVARLITLTDRLSGRLARPLPDILERRFGADDRIDILRPVWSEQMRRVNRFLDDLERGAHARGIR